MEDLETQIKTMKSVKVLNHDVKNAFYLNLKSFLYLKIHYKFHRTLHDFYSFKYFDIYENGVQGVRNVAKKNNISSVEDFFQKKKMLM